MTKNAYIGVSNSARKVKDIYLGVAGTARKISKAYVGVSGTAKQWWPSFMPVPSQIAALRQQRTASTFAKSGNKILFIGGQYPNPYPTFAQSTLVDTYDESLSLGSLAPVTSVLSSLGFSASFDTGMVLYKNSNAGSSNIDRYDISGSKLSDLVPTAVASGDILYLGYHRQFPVVNNSAIMILGRKLFLVIDSASTMSQRTIDWDAASRVYTSPVLFGNRALVFSAEAQGVGTSYQIYVYPMLIDSSLTFTKLPMLYSTYYSSGSSSNDPYGVSAGWIGLDTTMATTTNRSYFIDGSGSASTSAITYAVSTGGTDSRAAGGLSWYRLPNGELVSGFSSNSVSTYARISTDYVRTLYTDGHRGGSSNTGGSNSSYCIQNLANGILYPGAIDRCIVAIDTNNNKVYSDQYPV